MQEKVAAATAGSGYTPPTPGGEALIPKNAPPTQVSEREARPDANPSPESYTDTGKLNSSTWLEKVKKHNKATGKPDRKPTEETPSPATEPAAAPARTHEKKPAEQPVAQATEQDPAASPAEEGQVADPADPNAEAAPAAFVPNPKFNVMGKEYEIPKVLVDAITTPEQEKELRDTYTRAMAFDHTKARHQELNDKFTGLQSEHNEVVEGIDELKEIYEEAVTKQNPLLLNEFFAKLQIPPQVILQYAQSLSEYLNLDPAQQQTVLGTLEAHKRAREAGKQNQRLTKSQSQSQVSARTLELDSVLARPEVSTSVQSFEQKYGPGSFKQELIRNGIYVWQTEKRDLSVAENVSQVMQRFGLTAAPAAGSTTASVPQVPAAAPAPAAPAAPAAAPQGKPAVIPAQPHNKVPVIPGVTGKSTSPMKQAPRSIEDLKAIRKQKFGH